MSEKRSKMDIVFDILKAINDKGGTIIPTHLLYKSNLSHQRMNEYLADLMQKKLVQESERKGKKVYVLTDEGYKFLNEYRKLKEFTEAFGM